jgi:hypothetical protein
VDVWAAVIRHTNGEWPAASPAPVSPAVRTPIPANGENQVVPEMKMPGGGKLSARPLHFYLDPGLFGFHEG